jgi:CheY-like chemotaxis protein
MANQLEQEGYTVLKASELIHAEALFAEQPPDLVLLEVKSGRDAGWELLERLIGQTRVIVVSAYGREEDVVRGLQAGALDYIAKPYRSAELLARVRLCLNRAHHDPDATQLATPLTQPSEPATLEVQTAVETQDEPFPPDMTSQPPYRATDQLAPQGRPPDMADQLLYQPPSPDDHNRREITRDESVFMTETEELALLRASDETPAPENIAFSDGMSLGQRLNMERLRRRITLVQAESELHIRMWYLQAMEEEKFTLLPRGPLSVQMMRSYAAYLGLNADAMVDEYKRLHYTDPVAPPAFLGSGRRPSRLPRWAILLVAVILALTISISGIFFFDPTGATALGDNLRSIIAPVPTATPTHTPTPQSTATATATPTPTPTPESTATATPDLDLPPAPPLPPAEGEPPPPPPEGEPEGEPPPPPPEGEPPPPPPEGEPPPPPPEGEPPPSEG